MYTSPNALHMLETATRILADEVLSHVGNPAVAQKAEMCVAVLRSAAQLMPVEQQVLSEECREMRDLLAGLARLVQNDESAEAERIRHRADTGASNTQIEVPARDEVIATHRKLSSALIPTLDDLHALDAKNITVGADGLALVRSHLAQRAARDFEVYLGAPTSKGMIGRD
jgi:hypothetical protein